jgi:hypothetical protein
MNFLGFKNKIGRFVGSSGFAALIKRPEQNSPEGDMGIQRASIAQKIR